ncbi:phosphodiesterase, MJ0936 family [Haloterrigena turkmenica DSM 5511]|uniref:Phosphoesterase n=1 Tax=Haloterrigena turkmenica (strain ATCC 51198 / DSM 5511 / JCM 9101 / NCIMB 13204 / VKM B-1734 / 4k) TaxID=543526 RepID=D2RUU6_HALTV|nr:metallophosphoesterase [Haloterrigena turkmenica]ADB59239.1 phosphodiesterase, MJ0936 family [Haloterrigena turkmenica DSM 5511]
MIAIFSDTHSSDGHDLEGEALSVAREADTVIHAGDFTSASALEAFQRECNLLYAVHGNADGPAVRERLPTARTVEAGGVRFAVTHRRDGGETGLAIFGRSRDADVVVFGHSHRPTVTETEDLLLLNPGSHADPRGNRPGFAVLEERANGDGLEGEIHEPDGTVLESFELEVRHER